MKLTPKNSTTRVITYRSTLLCEVTLPTAFEEEEAGEDPGPGSYRDRFWSGCYNASAS
jgi:hypothetical protein